MCGIPEQAGASPDSGLAQQEENMAFFLQMFLYNYIGQNGITSSIGEWCDSQPATGSLCLGNAMTWVWG